MSAVRIDDFKYRFTDQPGGFRDPGNTRIAYALCSSVLANGTVAVSELNAYRALPSSP